MKRCNKNQANQLLTMGYPENMSFELPYISEWLRVKFNININIMHTPHSQTYRYTITGNYQHNSGMIQNHNFMKFDSHDLALISAIDDAIKFQKDTNKNLI